MTYDLKRAFGDDDLLIFAKLDFRLRRILLRFQELSDL